MRVCQPRVGRQQSQDAAASLGRGRRSASAEAPIALDSNGCAEAIRISARAAGSWTICARRSRWSRRRRGRGRSRRRRGPGRDDRARVEHEVAEAVRDQPAARVRDDRLQHVRVRAQHDVGARLKRRPRERLLLRPGRRAQLRAPVDVDDHDVGLLARRLDGVRLIDAAVAGREARALRRGPVRERRVAVEPEHRDPEAAALDDGGLQRALEGRAAAGGEHAGGADRAEAADERRAAVVDGVVVGDGDDVDAARPRHRPDGRRRREEVVVLGRPGLAARADGRLAGSPRRRRGRGARHRPSTSARRRHGSAPRPARSRARRRRWPRDGPAGRAAPGCAAPRPAAPAGTGSCRRPAAPWPAWPRRPRRRRRARRPSRVPARRAPGLPDPPRWP